MKGFQPLKDMVLLKPIVKERTDGGLWIPDKAKKKAMEGRVVAVGPGRVTDKGVRLETGLKVGDVVFVRFYHESLIELDGEKFMMLPADQEIIGVLED